MHSINISCVPSTVPGVRVKDKALPSWMSHSSRNIIHLMLLVQHPGLGQCPVLAVRA